MFLGGNCIGWVSKKQQTVARSSSEAEYRAMASTAAELVWITFLLRDLGVRLDKPPQIFSDNLSVLYLSVNLMFHARSKHFEIDWHFVREKVAVKQLITRFVPSQLQIADILTKAVSKNQFRTFRDNLRVQQLHRLREGVNDIIKILRTQPFVICESEIVLLNWKPVELLYQSSVTPLVQSDQSCSKLLEDKDKDEDGYAAVNL